MCRKMIYFVSFILVLGLVSSASAELVGHWKLDEGSGTTAMDATGNGHDGELIGNPEWVIGYFVEGLKFAGSPDKVDVPYSAELNPENEFTVSVWANLDPSGSGHRSPITSRDDYPQRGYILYCTPENTWQFWTGTGSAWDSAGSPAVALGEWTHVAATYSNGEKKLYINGELAGESSATMPPNTAQVLRIGAGATEGNGNYFFVGMIDDVRVYNHVLTDADIQASMLNQGSAMPKAYGPEPRSGTMLEDTWINLMWQAGDFAVSHDVYMGDNFDDVNAGAEGTFQGNQAATNLITGFFGFPYPDGLVPGTTYYWRIDEVNDADPNSPWKGDVWSFWIPPRTAYNPKPNDGVKFEKPDVMLSWTAGFRAKLHYVFFGDNFDDVNNAIVGLPQSETTYTPGTLELEKTYYWRIDEFDGVATYKGDVWSFRILPEIPITDPNLIGWWTLDEDSGTTVVDWSGHDNHGMLEGDPQWVDGYGGRALEFDGDDDTVTFGTGPALSGTTDFSVAAWIKTSMTSAGVIIQQRNGGYNGEYRLMVNSDAQLNLMLYGDSDYQYDFSTTKTVNDGNWHHAAFVRQGPNGYIYIDGNIEASESGTLRSLDSSFQVAVGSDIRDSINYFNGTIDDARVYNKALTQEEIQLAMRGDPLLAWGPKPSQGSTPYIRDATPLSWSPGDNASQHDVYFGTDKDALADADASDTTGIYRGRQGVTIYTPPDVEWGGGPYYWRIDEYNTDATISKGNVWTFTIADFIEIDDIEDYNDYPPDEIFSTWIDGWEVPENGSLAGHADPPFAETDNVHGGRQSMPVYYENNFKYSEITMTLVTVRDWTEEGVGVLSLWFYGDSANAAEQMYVNLNGIATVYHDNPDAALIEEWTEWTIDLQEFAALGVNLTNVSTISIGFGDKNNLQAGGSGMVLFDDIRLYRPAPEAP
jgi:hypothetical protein